jgi:alpha-beta hydrolase superfamily lysophospholipase
MMGSITRSGVRASAAVLAAVVCGVLAGGAAAASCNPLSTRTCIAPFPSNYWTKVDPSSPTGLRADVTNDLIRPQLLSALPTGDGISPTGVFGGATGFSSGVGAVFEFDRAPVASSLPADGGAAVVAYDLDSGVRVPVDAMISDDAANPLLVSKVENVIQVFPRVRWEFGHRILVAVTKQLIVPGSTDPDFNALAAAQPAGSLRSIAYVNEVRAALGSAGLTSSNVRSATVFTVRPRNDSVGQTQSLMNDTNARSHAVRNLSISYDLLSSSIGGVVTGDVRVDNYRRKNGTTNVDFSGATRRDQWIPFRLTLPRSSGSKPARVVMYGHGLGGFKETDLVVTGSNADHGFATLSIDWPNHGMRSLDDGGNILLSLTPSKLAQHAGMLNQATIDMAGVYKAISTSLAKVDYMRPRWLLNPLGIGSDGKPDIDPAHVALEGTSLGGVLGSNFAAMSPKLDGISFAVSGVGLSHILSKTILWPLAFGFVMPHEATGAEHAVLLASLQQIVDPSDAINSFDFIRNPRSGQSKKPLLLMLGEGDSVVPNASSVAMANLAGIPLVGKQLFAMPGVVSSSSYASDGSGVRQYPPLTGPLDLPLVTEASSHGIFLWPSAVSDQEKFLDRIAR